MDKDRRHSSIHDIMRVNGGDVAAPQGGPIGDSCGQGNNAMISSSNGGGQPSCTPSTPGICMYGATIGQLIGGRLVPEVSTLVAGPHLDYWLKPPPIVARPHLAYGLRMPPVVIGVVVASALVSFSSLAYPIPNVSAKR